MTPQMDNQDFDEYARAKTFNLSVADSWKAAFGEFLSAQPARQNVRFLDLGCGDGKYFQYLVALGLSSHNIHGVEVSQLRVDRCRALGWDRAVFVANGEPLPYADDFFDVVNMMEVIEHVPAERIAGVLEEVRRVLRPSGRLIVSTPNYPIKRFYDIFDAVVHGKWARLRDDPTHVAFYNHDRLARVLGGFFARVEERCFKSGFLYRRVIRSKATMHKMLFVASEKRQQAVHPPA